MRRSRLQRTTTTGLISCDAGGDCQRSEDSVEVESLQTSSPRGVLLENVFFLATRWISSGAKCVEMVLGNVGHGTRLNIATRGCWLVWTVTVLLTETWYLVDL